ncbi:heat shock protein 70kD, peptide-binding domain-containing protein [Leptodontidium sp. MPI-SDFR-AT-0119]|nr:heat shock protein 70kD, peptide-binding domain-containing protein [Leptodontidium sp. MPI-SDFR-AT-0119]
MRGSPVDITPLDLGIETSTGDFAKLISRRRMIPVANSIIVSTAEDNQENVTIRILEGARETAFGNRELGTLNLTGLPHKPKGETNGVLYVSAGCKGRSKVEELVVGARKYTNDEIRSLVASSDLPAENDAQQGNEGPVAVKDGVDVYSLGKKVTRTFFPRKPWRLWKDTD